MEWCTSGYLVLKKYLEIYVDYIEVFTSPCLDLRGRIVLISKVSFFSGVEVVVFSWEPYYLWKFRVIHL
jgi:hypothetical protein